MKGAKQPSVKDAGVLVAVLQQLHLLVLERSDSNFKL